MTNTYVSPADVGNAHISYAATLHGAACYNTRIRNEHVANYLERVIVERVAEARAQRFHASVRNHVGAAMQAIGAILVVAGFMCLVYDGDQWFDYGVATLALGGVIGILGWGLGEDA
jgi:hypothetical protein